MTRAPTVTRFTATRAVPRAVEQPDASRRRKHYAPDATCFDRFSALCFSTAFRPGMGRICEPGRSLHVPIPGSAESYRDHLHVPARGQPASTRLYRVARQEHL